MTPIKSPIAAEVDEKGGAPLNFRVSAAFRREFRTYAAQHDLKLNELLRLAFEHYQTRASVTDLSRSIVTAASILTERDDDMDLSVVLQELLERWITEQTRSWPRHTETDDKTQKIQPTSVLPFIWLSQAIRYFIGKLARRLSLRPFT